MGGYAGIGPEAGKFVPEEEAYEYALFRCTKGTLEEQKEFREAFVEWYYSGNWVWEDQIAEDRDHCAGDHKRRTA